MVALAISCTWTHGSLSPDVISHMLLMNVVQHSARSLMVDLMLSGCRLVKQDVLG